MGGRALISFSGRTLLSIRDQTLRRDVSISSGEIPGSRLGIHSYILLLTPIFALESYNTPAKQTDFQTAHLGITMDVLI